MSASALRVGVVGAGSMGADHARTLHRWASGAEVALAADVDAERAAAVAAETGARGTTDAHELITDPDVDAIVIASHDSTHADRAIAAVRAGSHPAYVELKTALASGTHGAPLLLHCVSRGVASAPGCTDEFSVTGSAIHEFDTVPWLLDSPVVEVSWHAGRSTSTVTGLRDPQLMLLRTADGALTTVETFLNAGYGYDVGCEVVTEHGTLALTDPARLVTTRPGPAPPPTPPTGARVSPTPTASNSRRGATRCGPAARRRWRRRTTAWWRGRSRRR
nr:Gfo/Idh/MocA family oxidoreductase [Streptomyces antibioticus]